ncbi:hypothetical protein V7159_24630 [Priestia megaterium]|uniref:hypothetical protein n=1 Tax=Priestia megaterium TaxID=1404 RepID=UPI00300B5EAD
MSIYGLIDEVLTPIGIPVFAIAKKGTPETYITYSQYAEESALIVNDKETHTGYYIQVDLWTKDNMKYIELSEKIKKTLVDKGFVRRASADLYEIDTQIYHKGMRFYYVYKQSN